MPPPLLSFLSWTLLAVASILGLLLIGQGAAAVGHIRALPTPFNWIVGVAATGFSLVLAALIMRLGWALMRLRRSPAVNLAGLRTLSERRQWQRLAVHHVDRARIELRRHLQEYECRAAHPHLTWIIREEGDSGGDTGASVWYKRCVHKRLATMETPA